MTDLAEVQTDTYHREPTARTIELAEVINLALAGDTYRQIADHIFAPTTPAEDGEPFRSTKPQQDAIRELLTSPDGQRALRYAISEHQEVTDRFLVSTHLRALRTLAQELDGPKASDRIRAATAITGLATKRIEISGVGGGPIDVNAAVIDVLDEKIALMRERSKGIIEAYGVEVPVEVETVVEVPVVSVADKIAEILASIPVPVVEPPAVVEAIPVASAPPRRMPAPIIRPRGR